MFELLFSFLCGCILPIGGLVSLNAVVIRIYQWAFSNKKFNKAVGSSHFWYLILVHCDIIYDIINSLLGCSKGFSAVRLSGEGRAWFSWGCSWVWHDLRDEGLLFLLMWGLVGCWVFYRWSTSDWAFLLFWKKWCCENYNRFGQNGFPFFLRNLIHTLPEDKHFPFLDFI